MAKRRYDPSIVLIRGSKQYATWLDRLAKKTAAVDRCDLVVRALADLAERVGFDPPPRRTNPRGTNRFGPPKDSRQS